MNWKKLLWRWSWIITLPITIVFLYWGGVTIERYTTFCVRFPSLFNSLFSCGEVEFQHIIRKAQISLNWSVKKKLNENHSIRTINLFVSESNLKKLDQHLPQSGFKYVEGGLWDGKKLHKVKIKYRGDNSFHWDFYKKSLRIKTKKKDLFEGMRLFNLVVPKLDGKLHNYLGYQLANMLGLITPRSEIVNVSLNGNLIGIYILVEQVDESTLRNHKLMPADIYSGELVGMDAYIGISPDVFAHPGLWGKKSINNHYPADFNKPLEKLTGLVNADDSDSVHQELTKLLDMKSWGKFSAFETLTQSFHYDDQHNWRIYYDPYKRCFIPIAWDPMPWHDVWVPKNGESAQLDILTSKLHNVLFKNGDFLRARQKAIEDFYSADKNTEFLKIVDRTIDSITPALYVDPNLRPANTRKSIVAMRSLRKNIEKIFKDIEQGFIEQPEKISYSVKSNGNLKICIGTRQPLDSFILSYNKSVSGPVTAQIGFLEEGKEVNVDITGAVSVEANQIKVSKVFLPRMVSTYSKKARTRYQRHRKKILPGYYELKLKGIDRNNSLFDVYYERNGERINAQAVDDMKFESFEKMYRLVTANPASLPIIWDGEVNIEKSIEIKSPLIIHAGTTVHLSPGVSVILKNQLLAEGTSVKPIRFVPGSPEVGPWGAFVLWGSGVNGSRLEHCSFSGGSGSKGDLFEYTAMLSVHDADGIYVSNTRFSDSKKTDDMVHVVYSKVHFKDCIFENSLMDALDSDISYVLVEQCHFYDSGNDSIDLMTSNAVVVDTVIEKSGDKAVSVGEGSSLLAINNIFGKNSIGVQAKDGSVAALYNINFNSNDQALDAYKKNWRYGNGGKIFVYKSRFDNNGKMITADKKSMIYISDSFSDRSLKRSKRIQIDSATDQMKKHQSKSASLIRLKQEIEAMKGFNTRYWHHVDPKIRGVADFADH